MNDSDPADEVALAVWGSGAEASKARLRDGVVLRQAGPWSPSVLGLLRHLEEHGFAGAPRVVGDGYSADGREQVTFVEGTSPHPGPWKSEQDLHGIGVLLRDLHATAATYLPPAGSPWKSWFGRDLPGDRPVLGHCDTAPWNILVRDGTSFSLIDWEFAGPVDAIWELAHTAWLNGQLHDDDIAERMGLPPAPVRAGQVHALLEGYELPARERRNFADRIIEFAVHSARQEAVDGHVTPESTAAVSDTGYPLLWALAWRIKDAAWLVRNRRLLQDALAA